LQIKGQRIVIPAIGAHRHPGQAEREPGSRLRLSGTTNEVGHAIRAAQLSHDGARPSIRRERNLIAAASFAA
jgi:hypothetical protein